MSTGKIEGFYSLKGGEFSDAGVAATQLRAALREAGFSHDDVRRAAVSAFEAEMNVIIHAVAGTLHYELKGNEVRITVTDMGPGIKDIDEAMRVGFTTAPKWAKDKGWGGGMGLPNIKDNADSMHIDTVAGEGTTLRISVTLSGGHQSVQEQED